MESILVTGGTGTLGRQVVGRLRETDRDVRVLTRRTGMQEDGISFVTGDLLSRTGVDLAVDGIAKIIHCAGSSKGDDVATRNLVDAAERAGRPHIVYISVVGAERMPMHGLSDRMMFSYFDMKRQAEEIVAQSELPSSTLRATQFFDLILMVLEKIAKLPIIPIPSGVSFQPIDSGEVAARLVELVLTKPSGLVPDIGGPQVYETADLLRGYLKATGKRRILLPLRLPGKAARALRAGANLAPDRAIGQRTWEGFLADHMLG